jgi:hypothetical protein
MVSQVGGGTKFQDVDKLPKPELARLRQLAGELPVLCKEFDELLARHGLASLKIHSFALSDKSDESFRALLQTNRRPGAGLSSDGFYVASSEFNQTD